LEGRGGDAGVARIGCIGGEARCGENAGVVGGNAAALNDDEGTRDAPSRDDDARGGELATLRLANDDWCQLETEG
jgi:hypothetical protein